MARIPELNDLMGVLEQNRDRWKHWINRPSAPRSRGVRGVDSMIDTYQEMMRRQMQTMGQNMETNMWRTMQNSSNISVPLVYTTTGTGAWDTMTTTIDPAWIGRRP